MITVEVAYAKPDQQKIIELRVLPNSTIEDAIRASKIVQQFPEIDLTTAKVGVFGKLASLQTRLADKDRVEIYRPLTIDPKEARKARVKQQRTRYS